MYTEPTITEFKAKFPRNFPYGAGRNNVKDADIQSGLDQSYAFANPDLFCNQADFTNASLFLAAHFMVLDLRMAMEGLYSEWLWPTQSKGAGNMDQSFAIPDEILENPEYAMLASTAYGTRFIFLVYPKIRGQIFTVAGATHP